MDEVVADYVGTLLENNGELERFIEKHRADRTLIEKLRDIVRDIVRKLKGTSQGSQLSHVEKRLSETLDAAVKQAGKNAKAQKNTTQKSGGEVKYSTKHEVLALDGVDWMDNYSSIKDQLQKHANEINAMEPVAVVEFTPKSAPKLASTIMDEVAKLGGRNIKRGNVTFEFDQKGVGSILAHAKTSELQAAALASPYVAKYGKLISGQKNHENTGLATLTYAAPVIINGTTVNVGVVIQFMANGKPRAVNVGLQSGGVFKIDMKKAPKGLDSRISRYGQGTALPTMGAYDGKVPQNRDAVKIEKAGVSVDSKTESAYPGKLSLKDSTKNPYNGKSLSEDSTVYSYDFLVSLPDMVVIEMPSLSDIKTGDKVDQQKAIEMGLKNAAQVGRKVTDTISAVKNRYTGSEIRVSQNGLGHSLGGENISRLRTNARLTAIGGEVIQNAVPVNALKSKNAQARGTYSMAALLKSGERDVVAIVTVEQHTDRVTGIDYVDIAHSINGRLDIKKEGSRSSTRETGTNPATASFTVSISDFLDVVNNTHRSILSTDVTRTKKNGQKEREPLTRDSQS